MRGSGLDSTGPVTFSCERSNEPFDSVKGGEYFLSVDRRSVPQGLVMELFDSYLSTTQEFGSCFYCEFLFINTYVQATELGFCQN